MITQIDIDNTDDSLKCMSFIFDNDTHKDLHAPIVVIPKKDTNNTNYMKFLSSCNKLVVIASTSEYVNKFIFSPIVNPIKNSITNHINMLMLLNFGILTITTKYVRD